MAMSQTRKKIQKKKKNSRRGIAVLAAFIIVAAFLLYAIGVIKIPVGSLANDSIEKQNTAFQTFFIDKKTHQKLRGLQTIDNKIYGLNSTTGAELQGLQKINGWYYYFTADGSDNVVDAYHAVAPQLTSNNSVIEKTIASGLKLVGKSPYDYGGGRTATDVAANKFDCSSFIAQMWREGGQSLVYQEAATTSLLSETGTTVSWNDKKRGDLIVTGDNATEDEEHIGIYLGDGFMLHDSASTGGVAISRLNEVIDPSVLGNMTWTQLFTSVTGGTVQREVG